VNEYDHFRAVIENVLALTANLTDAQCDRIRHAVKTRHSGGQAMLTGTAAAETGGRLLDLLGDADTELAASQVEQLEELIYRTLRRID